MTVSTGRRLRRRLSAYLHSFYIDFPTDQSTSVLIAGSGRSGTTWLLDTLNFKNEYRVLYEPFNRGRVPIIAHFRRYQYLRTDNDDPAYFEPVRRILTGNIRNWWIDAHNRRFICRQRIIKNVRCMFMLGWMARRFPGMPILYLMRHQCAVATSRMHLGWEPTSAEYLTQADLVADHLAPFKRVIEEAQSSFARHIVDWCVENYVPMRQLRPADAHVLFYEDACMTPESEVVKLGEILHKDFGDAALQAMRKPSLQARRRREQYTSAVVSGESLIDNWRKFVTSEQLAKAVETVTAFGLDWHYAEGSMPVWASISTAARSTQGTSEA